MSLKILPNYSQNFTKLFSKLSQDCSQDFTKFSFQLPTIIFQNFTKFFLRFHQCISTNFSQYFIELFSKFYQFLKISSNFFWSFSPNCSQDFTKFSQNVFLPFCHDITTMTYVDQRFWAKLTRITRKIMLKFLTKFRQILSFFRLYRNLGKHFWKI